MSEQDINSLEKQKQDLALSKARAKGLLKKSIGGDGIYDSSVTKDILGSSPDSQRSIKARNSLNIARWLKAINNALSQTQREIDKSSRKK